MEVMNLRSFLVKDAKKDPFDHYVIDDFISEDLALKLYNQFPDYHSEKWYSYDNPLERKKAIQTWGSFPPETYQFFMALCSQEFVNQLRVLTGCKDLIPDIGLHGAGWHMSTRGDHLNIHQDYSIHPLANMQRKFNIIIYLTPDWKPEWGGNLEFWSHDEEKNCARERAVSIDCKFRRAVLFDTTQNSWHGFPNIIGCPEGVQRKSIAMYYLAPITKSAKSHKRALYVPRKDQENDIEIQEMIRARSKI
jgi:Rps23 Pro-64 3,4-dihydroxylase Tpa1-like proline 4-hydroxylase